jgi:dephospho-CoA kinase
MATIIGIAGNMRSGKSALAQRLSIEYDIPIVSYAEALRQEVAQAFFPKQGRQEARHLWNLLEEEDKTLTRPMLQAWGEGRRQLVRQTYWIDRLNKYVARKGYDIVIVDDVRHENEAQDIIDQGGYIIKLSADSKILMQRGATQESLLHASENLGGVDSVVSANKWRSIEVDTSGRSVHGLFKACQQVVEEWIS